MTPPAIAKLGTADRIDALDHANGTLLAVGSDGQFLIWRQDEDGWLAVDAPRGGARWAAALSPDGAGVYVSDGSLVQLAPIRKHLRALRPFVEAPGRVRRLLWSPRGDVLVVDSEGGILGLDWSGRELWRRPMAGPLAWHPSGDRLLVGGPTGATWVDGATGVDQQGLDLGLEPQVLAVGTTGLVAFAVSGEGRGRVQILGADMVEEVEIGSIHALAWSPDGRSLAAACSDGDAIVWERGGRLAHRVRTPQQGLSALAWLDDQRLAVAGRGDGPAVVIFTLG